MRDTPGYGKNGGGEMKTATCRDGVRSDAAGGEKGDGDGHPDLTISVFLRGGFVRELEGHDYEAGQGTLAASVEGGIRSLYPGASVSVRMAELLDGDWEVQIGELGRGRMGISERGAIERHLRSAVREAITRFRGSDG